MSSSASNTRDTDAGQYFFIIENLPSLYTWQDLKDLVRRGDASHGVWTDMQKYPNANSGGKGNARVKRRDEAAKLYQYLTTTAVDGKTLRIHLFDTSGEQPQVLRCNCTNKALHTSQAITTQGAPRQPGMASAQPTYPTSSASPYTQPPMLQPILPQNQLQQGQAATVQQTMAALANMQISPQDPRYAAVQQYRYAQAQQAANQQASRYATSMSGLPVNVRGGPIRTEFRGVFVSGLPFKAGKKDVQNYFAQAGEITRCDVQKDATTGKSRGKATIQYRSAAEAQQAITLFDGKDWQNQTLKVRLDTDGTVISPPPTAQPARTGQPIIVNGSQAATARRDSAQQFRALKR